MVLRLKRIVSTLLVVAFIAAPFHNVGALQISGTITNEVVGTVVEIFDADAIAVRLYSSQIAYVRLLGIKASTGAGGLKYMHDNVLGRTVTLFPDYTGTASGMVGRWNLMYVYLSSGTSYNLRMNENLNQTLVKLGYAEIDEKYPSISQYAALASEQAKAKSLKVGIWGDGLNSYYSSSDKININTASSKILDTYMTGVYIDSVISDILSYRSYAPFATVEELKFVNGMTRDIFSENRHLFSVITNINTATEKELKSLEYSQASDIDDIIKYRSSQKFDSLTDLYNKADVPRDFYDRNRYYMSVDDNTKMVYAKPNKTVNVNTASESQLSDISDVSSSLASRIVNARRNGYTLKTLMELREIGGISTESVHRLSDNCHLYTDVNSATVTELESLFGNSYISSEIDKILELRSISSVERVKNVMSDERYNRILKFIYAKELVLPERVNLNTASESQMREIGIPFSDTSSILSAQKRMKTASQIPVNVSAYDKSVALYTNINTASMRELRSLNAFSESAINLIITSRDEQPFGSESELSDFFVDNRLSGAYNSVKEFITVR